MTQTHAIVETGQPAPEVIRNIGLSMIRCNPFNPRKNRTDEDLEELKTSIVNYGIIQPVTVRSKDGVYEIVCGERRYHASLKACLSTIPAIVKDYSDDEAMEISILENLQRRDISPVEEAVSFSKLIEVRGYSIEELCLKFGKTDKYIRSRLQLRNLLDEIAELLVREEITLSIALELSRFCQEIQKDVYTEHLQDDSYSWKKLPVKDFRKLLENGYSMDLSNYEFDKGDCLKCRFNSSICDLFADGNCGVCQNMECLKYKQAEFMASETARLMNEKQGMIAAICVAPNSFASAEVVGNLSETGCDIYEMSATPMPVIPEKPVPENFTSETEYQDAEVFYERNLEQHQTFTAQIEEMIKAGKAEMMVDVSNRTPNLCYRVIPETGTQQAEGDTVEKLHNQDKRNREIAFEKGVEEIKQLVRESIVPPGEIQPLEEGLLCYIMLSYFWNESYEKLLINPQSMLTDDDKAGVVTSLTEEQKNIVHRGFIAKYLANASGDRRQAQLLIEFASLHFPVEVNQIKQQQNETYKKRHTRIQERILALQPVTGTQAVKVAEVPHISEASLEEQFAESVLPNALPVETVTAEKTVATDNPETVFPEMTDEQDTNVTVLYPGLPGHAAVGNIPEEEEKILDTVYEDAAA